MSGWGHKLGCDGQYCVKAVHGAEGNDVGRGSGFGQGFGAGGDYIYVRQCKCAGDFAEESGFLVIRLDQRQGNCGSPQFQRESGEAGA